MDNLHHKPIKSFSLDGNIYDDSAIARLKIEYIKLLLIEMKTLGYVPRLDIDPDFTISYNGKTFEFKLSVYGVYVGKKRAKCVKGIDKNQVITSTTTQNLKSEEVF